MQIQPQRLIFETKKSSVYLYLLLSAFVLLYKPLLGAFWCCCDKVLHISMWQYSIEKIWSDWKVSRKTQINPAAVWAIGLFSVLSWCWLVINIYWVKSRDIFSTFIFCPGMVLDCAIIKVISSLQNCSTKTEAFMYRLAVHQEQLQEKIMWRKSIHTFYTWIEF